MPFAQFKLDAALQILIPWSGSLVQWCWGYETTPPVTLEGMLHHASGALGGETSITVVDLLF